MAKNKQCPWIVSREPWSECGDTGFVDIRGNWFCARHAVWHLGILVSQHTEFKAFGQATEALGEGFPMFLGVEPSRFTVGFKVHP